MDFTPNFIQRNAARSGDEEYPDGHDVSIENQNTFKEQKEDADSNDKEKEEITISGCRRRIQNRPNKKNPKSKSFCEQRKLRSHSPLPERKQMQNKDCTKSKVIC